MQCLAMDSINKYIYSIISNSINIISYIVDDVKIMLILICFVLLNIESIVAIYEENKGL